METITREINQRFGDVEIKGIVIVKDGTYKYDYPYMREVKKALQIGDNMKIARICGYSLPYVNDCLNGSRYNELILEKAYEIIQSNKKLGIK